MERENIFGFYERAKALVVKAGFQEEIDFVEGRRFKDMEARDFLYQYVYVVLNSGMKNTVAEAIYRRYLKEGSRVIGHEGKRKAVIQAQLHYRWWFRQLKSNYDDVQDMLDFLETLPWIGPITKYHLARNLGIDVAKPDRHLQRIAEHFGYSDVQKMCRALSESTGERIGTIDLVLWRSVELSNGKVLIS